MREQLGQNAQIGFKIFRASFLRSLSDVVLCVTWYMPCMPDHDVLLREHVTIVTHLGCMHPALHTFLTFMLQLDSEGRTAPLGGTAGIAWHAVDVGECSCIGNMEHDNVDLPKNDRAVTPM